MTFGLPMLDGARPCPFCGSGEIAWCMTDFDGFITENFYEMYGITARCSCGCHVHLINTEEILDEEQAKKAILDKWNERTITSGVYKV